MNNANLKAIHICNSHEPTLGQKLQKSMSCLRTEKQSERKLVLSDKSGDNSYDKLLNNIENLRRRLGDDYLEAALRRTSGLKDDIIIAVENIKAEH